MKRAIEELDEARESHNECQHAARLRLGYRRRLRKG
jgi:hypothetical protein